MAGLPSPEARWLRESHVPPAQRRLPPSGRGVRTRLAAPLEVRAARPVPGSAGLLTPSRGRAPPACWLAVQEAGMPRAAAGTQRTPSSPAGYLSRMGSEMARRATEFGRRAPPLPPWPPPLRTVSALPGKGGVGRNQSNPGVSHPARPHDGAGSPRVFGARGIQHELAGARSAGRATWPLCQLGAALGGSGGRSRPCPGARRHGGDSAETGPTEVKCRSLLRRSPLLTERWARVAPAAHRRRVPRLCLPPAAPGSAGPRGYS